MSKVLIVVISCAAGLLVQLVPPFVFPGYIFGALFFPEAVHSDHAIAWLIIALLFNFALYGGLTFAIFRRRWPD
jgi:hypothetical protein